MIRPEDMNRMRGSSGFSRPIYPVKRPVITTPRSQTVQHAPSQAVISADTSSPINISTQFEPLPNSQKVHKPRLKIRINYKIAASISVVILVGAGGFTYLSSAGADPIPVNVQKQVSFPVYYPDQSLLPAGFTFSTSSIHSSQLAVVYEVKYGAGQQLVFTVQGRPTDDQLSHFYKMQMPLNRTLSTNLGTATIGTINNRTVASLPGAKAWILATGPSNITNSQLDQVLKSIQSP